MRLLVTRPEPDATALARRLQAAGHEAIVEPLLAVVPAPELTALELSGAQALLVTSRNALRALDAAGLSGTARNLAVIAVGPGTAEAAREAGFAEVRAGPAGAAELAALVAGTLSPSAGAVLHVSGEEVAFDLVGALAAVGFAGRRVVTYRTQARSTLTETVQQHLRTGGIDGVVLMSPRTAEVYVDLIARHGLHRHLGSVVHLCLSAAVAARLAPLGELVKVISPQPNLEEMLALTERVAAQFLQSLDDRS